MIRALKAFADWLDRRFPPKKVVTEEIFRDFEHRLSNAIRNSSGFNNDFMAIAKRLQEAEESIRAIKELLAKGGVSAMKIEADKLRDQFVRGEFQRGPSRQEIESNS